MFSTVGIDPEKRKQMMMASPSRPDLTAESMSPSQPGVVDQFKTMAAQQVMGDAIGAGTTAAYKKGGELYDKIMTDPVKTPSVLPKSKPAMPPTNYAQTMAFEPATAANLPAGGTNMMMKAPLSSSAVPSATLKGQALVQSGAPVASSTLAGTGATTTGATLGTQAAAGAGGSALTGAAAATPYVAAALAADELLGTGIRESILGFSHGGFVGLGPLALEKMNEEGIKSGGLLGLAMMSAGGPVNAIEYNSQGDKVKVSYAGPLQA